MTIWYISVEMNSFYVNIISEVGNEAVLNDLLIT